MVWRRWTVDDEAEVLLMYGRGVTIEEVMTTSSAPSTCSTSAPA
ncbi:hypothetical protein [Agrococcus sp. Ld7]